MSNRILFGLIAFAVLMGFIAVVSSYMTPTVEAPIIEESTTPNGDELTVCTADAMLCPDGSYVGRTLPGCQFVCPAAPLVPADVQAQIDAMADQIVVSEPLPLTVIGNPLQVSGVARGGWYFEATAPVSLVNWDGLIIAEGFVTATEDWMTAEFVPFSGSLEFTSPYNDGDPDFMKRGTIIFQNDNPSGLPENSRAVEIPVTFLPN
jgi:hypothetical protein